jgi:hypothetical protein
MPVIIRRSAARGPRNLCIVFMPEMHASWMGHERIT